MLSVAQINFFRDPHEREPAELLKAWPTLVDVAQAATLGGAKVSVIQASGHWQSFDRDGIGYHFQPLVGVPFAELLARLKPDVLHVQGLGFAREVLILAALAPGIPIVLQDHADRPPRRPWRWPLWRRGLAAASGVMFCASEQATAFRRRGILTARTRVYEIPESSCRFTPGDRHEARNSTKIQGDPALLWVGHLNGNKDPLTVLEGLSLAARHLPGLQLWCCFGSAPLMEKVRAKIDGDSRLSGRVHLRGRVPHEEVERLMRAADFLVQGSQSEGSGYALIEALACGLPPLVTDIPSFRVLSGAAGRLWPRADAQALCQALLDLTGQPPALLRAAARGQFERELSPQSLGRKLCAVYDELSLR